MGKGYAETSLKRFLKRKIKITLGVVVAFLITGTVGYGGQIEIDEENKENNILNMQDIDGNSSKNFSRSDGDGVYYFKNSQGKDFDIINHLQTSSANGDDYFLCTGNNNETMTVLCRELNLRSYKSMTTMILVDYGKNNNIINLGTENQNIDKITIKANYRTNDKGLVFATGTNNKINFYANTVELKTYDEFDGVKGGKNKAVLGVGKANKNTAINVEAHELVDIEGDICIGYNPNMTFPEFAGELYSSNSLVNINQNYNGTVKIKGDIYTSNNYSSYRGNSTNIRFLGKESSLTGKVEDRYTKIDSNEKGYEYEGTHLFFDNGAHWDMTDHSYISSLELNNGSYVDMTYNATDFRLMTVYKSLNGTGGTINMNIDASKNKDNSDRIYISGTHDGVHYITLNNVAADQSTDGAEGTVLVSVKDEKGEFKANDSEGTLYWNKYELGRYDADNGDTVTDDYETDWYLKKTEKVDPEEKPTTDVETIMAANSMNYYTWRENDKLLQRMGELRYNGESEKGVWFRTKSSKLDKDDSFNFENRYTTYQVGYDEVNKRTDEFTRFQGLAFAYTDGKGSYRYGSGENDHASISFYNTDIYRDGQYFDVIFKVTGMDSDYKVYNSKDEKITGDFENVGLSLSTEYGKKYENDNNWYAEPQVQLTLGYLFGDSYETSSDVRVKQGDITSIIGRAGIHLGKETSETSKIYIKGNVLHEFDGDYKINMYSGEDKLTMNESFDDTWFEAGVGTARNVTENLHVYADVEKQFGSNIDSSWQFNIGFRYKFGGLKDFTFAAANLFDFDKSVIKPEGKVMIKDASDIMNKRKLKGTLTIEGHTDWTGTNEYNQRLSERRAKAVKEEFEQNLTNENIQCEAKGYGETRPVADNRTKEGRAKNRRVDIKFNKN